MAMSESMLLFTGGRVLDAGAGRLVDGLEVLVADGRIREVSDTPIRSDGAVRVDLAGRTLMPGLIDCHVHVVAAFVDLWKNCSAPSSLAALRSARIMNAMLMRGFTTVRDAGGADHGLVMGLAEGLVTGPRLVISGKALSQTGGHGDIRARSDDRSSIFAGRLGSMCRLADGVDAVRLAAREELKAGADFVKIMANGGVASPNDPIHALGYSRDEIVTIVEEARNAGTYVSAHLYTDEAIRRAVECGVHSLEHCNLIASETARLAADAGAIAVPTLVAYEALALEGDRFGLGPEAAAKIETVRKSGLESLATMQGAGLPMAFGSDLLGELQRHHCMEWEIRARVLPPAEIIASATLVGARLCRMEGLIGLIAPGAHADLLVVDGDPFADLSVLAGDGTRMVAIVKAGTFVKREL
jgi:imidazolonepropionase-like amidohydrolase